MSEFFFNIVDFLNLNRGFEIFFANMIQDLNRCKLDVLFYISHDLFCHIMSYKDLNFETFFDRIMIVLEFLKLHMSMIDCLFAQ